jgi:hypothetical protein
MPSILSQEKEKMSIFNTAVQRCTCDSRLCNKNLKVHRLERKKPSLLVNNNHLCRKSQRILSPKLHKTKEWQGAGGFTPVILATQEAEIRRTTV